MALNSLFCADVPLSNYSLTHSAVSHWISSVFNSDGDADLEIVLIRCCQPQASSSS